LALSFFFLGRQLRRLEADSLGCLSSPRKNSLLVLLWVDLNFLCFSVPEVSLSRLFLPLSQWQRQVIGSDRTEMMVEVVVDVVVLVDGFRLGLCRNEEKNK